MSDSDNRPSVTQLILTAIGVLLALYLLLPALVILEWRIAHTRHFAEAIQACVGPRGIEAIEAAYKPIEKFLLFLRGD